MSKPIDYDNSIVTDKKIQLIWKISGFDLVDHEHKFTMSIDEVMGLKRRDHCWIAPCEVLHKFVAKKWIHVWKWVKIYWFEVIYYSHYNKKDRQKRTILPYNMHYINDSTNNIV